MFQPNLFYQKLGLRITAQFLENREEEYIFYRMKKKCTDYVRCKMHRLNQLMSIWATQPGGGEYQWNWKRMERNLLKIFVRREQTHGVPPLEPPAHHCLHQQSEFNKTRRIIKQRRCYSAIRLSLLSVGNFRNRMLIIIFCHSCKLMKFRHINLK